MAGGGGVLAIGIHAHQLPRIFRRHGFRHRVGQRQRAIGHAPQLRAGLALAPAAAVTRFHRYRWLRRVASKLGQRVVHHQFAQAGIRDAEFRGLPNPADQAEILGVRLERRLVAREDAIIGMAGIQLDPLHRTIPRTPLSVRHLILRQRPKPIPDGPAIVSRMLPGVHRDGERRRMRYHLPMRSGKKLPVTKPIQQVPDPILHGEIGSPQNPQPMLMRTQKIILTLRRIARLRMKLPS